MRRLHLLAPLVLVLAGAAVPLASWLRQPPPPPPPARAALRQCIERLPLRDATTALAVPPSLEEHGYLRYRAAYLRPGDRFTTTAPGSPNLNYCP